MRILASLLSDTEASQVHCKHTNTDNNSSITDSDSAYRSFFQCEEVAMLSELTHIQEVAEQLEKISADPQVLPPSSEQVIQDLKGSDSWSFQTPPSSPSSLGSRKSSMCSISSLNSSSSGSSKSHHSPNHYWQRSVSQVLP